MTRQKRVLFDTYAIMSYAQWEGGRSITERYLDDVENDKIEGFISVISITEIIYKVGLRDLRLAYCLISFIEESNLKIIHSTYDVAKKAGNLKLKYKHVNLSTADSLIIASALNSKVDEILTGDREWKKIKEVEVVSV